MPTRLTLTQAGGFAGMLRHSVLQPHRLAAGDARRLGELVQALERHLAAPALASDAAMRDQHSYQLTLERTGCAPASCRFDDATVPADLWPLFRFLQQHGTPG